MVILCINGKAWAIKPIFKFLFIVLSALQIITVPSPPNIDKNEFTPLIIQKVLHRKNKPKVCIT